MYAVSRLQNNVLCNYHHGCHKKLTGWGTVKNLSSYYSTISSATVSTHHVIQSADFEEKMTRATAPAPLQPDKASCSHCSRLAVDESLAVVFFHYVRCHDSIQGPLTHRAVTLRMAGLIASSFSKLMEPEATPTWAICSGCGRASRGQRVLSRFGGRSPYGATKRGESGLNQLSASWDSLANVAVTLGKDHKIHWIDPFEK